MITYTEQIETSRICNKPGPKGIDCDEKFNKLGDAIPKRKIKTYAEILEKPSGLQKENQENEVHSVLLRQTLQHSPLQNIMNSTHDSSSNCKNYDWFALANEKKTLQEAIKP